jgi:hypothetical protein
MKAIHGGKATSYIWVCCGDDDRLTEQRNIVLYDYHNSLANTSTKFVDTKLYKQNPKW